jgi:fatty acid desaturase
MARLFRLWATAWALVARRRPRTGRKLAAVNGVVLLGCILIVWSGWPEAIKTASLDAKDYGPGPMAAGFLALIMVGIPTVLFAVLAHMALTWLLFRSGEIEEYEARKLLATLPRATVPERESGAGPARSYDE